MKNLIQKNWQKLVLSFYIFLFPVISFAGTVTTPDDPCEGRICNPLGSGTDSISDLVLKVLTGVLKIGIPVIALAIIYCGFLFVAARGKSEKLTEAKDALLYTLIGAAILLGAWTIANIIKSTVLAL